MAKAKEPSKEASNSFHNIMKASEKDNLKPSPKKKEKKKDG